MTNTNVFPVNGIDFRISTAGRSGAFSDFHVVRGMESFSISFDNGIEEWNPIDAFGWARRMVTTKGISVAISGKRVVGCVGNDYVAGLAFGSGDVLNTVLQVNFPNGDVLRVPCVVNVTACGGGGSGDVAVLEFECLSDGAPSYSSEGV